LNREKGANVADKVLINLATGMEDGERVLVAFLVATAAQAQGKQVAVWTTKDAVRLGLPGEMSGVVCKDCPPLERLLEQFTEGGGELWLCPICLASRDLTDAEKIANTKVVGATPMWEWAGSDTTVFSY
jgi:predicted peroxiredoxin